MTTFLTGRQYVLAGVLILSVIPYFVKLGSSSLWDSNEAFYAQTPREMIDSGDYVSPSFNGNPRFNKPPLVYWVVALFYKVFGVSEGVERLPIALGALALIATAFFLGREVYSNEAGLIAAISLAATPRFLMFSRRIIIDVYLAMFLSLALLMFILSQKAQHRKRLWLVLAYVFIALGMLTKGPVALLLPGLTLLLCLAPFRRIGELRNLMLPIGGLIILAIVVPWYAAVYYEHGWPYIKSFIIDDNVSRYTQPVWGPRRGLFFYFPVIIGDFFPWSVLLPAAIRQAVRDKIKRRNNISDAETLESDHSKDTAEVPQQCANERSDLAIQMLIWIGVFVSFFSLSRNKEDLYILPIYPAAAALIGGLVVRNIRSKTRAASVSLGTAAFGVVALGAGLLYALPKLRTAYELAGAQEIAYFALAGGLCAVTVVLVKRNWSAIVLLGLTLAVINWIFVSRALPDFEKYKPVRQLCDIIKAEAGPDAKVGYYGVASPSMAFYLQRPIFEYYRLEQLGETLSSNNQVFCLMTAQDYETIKGSLPVPTIVLASRPIFQVKLKSIFDRTETPQVVLISNKLGVRNPE